MPSELKKNVFKTVFLGEKKILKRTEQPIYFNTDPLFHKMSLISVSRLDIPIPVGWALNANN